MPAGENVAAAKSSASRPPRVQWNVLSAAGAFGGAKVGKEQDRAAWSVRAKYYRCMQDTDTACRGKIV
eukprot:187130-Pelagomonas_calceolata.AAC.1